MPTREAGSQKSDVDMGSFTHDVRSYGDPTRKKGRSLAHLLRVQGRARPSPPHRRAVAMSLGWLTESSIMPKRPKRIEQVGKASMVDLRAALYASEESLQQGSASSRAEERQQRERVGRELPAAAPVQAEWQSLVDVHRSLETHEHVQRMGLQ